MTKTLNVTLSIVVECEDDLSAKNVIDHLDFKPTEQDEVVDVIGYEVMDFFDV